MLFLRNKQRRWAVTALGMVLAAAAAWTCGFDWPNTLLLDSEKELVTSPVALFSEEVEAIAKEVPPLDWLKEAFERDRSPEFWEPRGDETRDADIAELRIGLKWGDNPPAEDEIERILEEYSAIREKIGRIIDAKTDQRWRADRTIYPASMEYLQQVQIPEGTPPPFAAYLRGAIAYHLEDMEAARAEWESIFDMAPEHRPQRAVWAAYMLGKSHLDSDPDQAVEWFRKAQEPDLGWDGPGLRASSVKWEGLAERKRGNPVRAIEIFLTEYSSGRLDAIHELKKTAGRLLESASKEVLVEAAKHPLVQRLLAAYVISHPTYLRFSEDGSKVETRAERWLSILQEIPFGKIDRGDQLALAAYQTGDIELTRNWLALASEESLLAQWVRGKLLLREGKMDEAKRVYERIADARRPERYWREWGTYVNYHHLQDRSDRVWGELGVLQLDAGEFEKSLDSFLGGNYIADAAYVAEKVLTLGELRNLVDSNWRHTEGEAASKIRHILARRLMREDNHLRTREYFPEDLRPAYDQYIRALRISRNLNNTTKRRAEALMEAARIVRHQGLELFGTEVDPDWAFTNGAVQLNSVAFLRVGYPQVKAISYWDPDQEWEDTPETIRRGRSLLRPNLFFNPARREEERRVRQHGPVPDIRFHYRYVAAALAWQAAEMLPDDHEETARALWEAGRWLKGRDPVYADHFYKALVRRNPNIPLAQEADRIRWFPKADENGEPILRSAGGETVDREVEEW